MARISPMGPILDRTHFHFSPRYSTQSTYGYMTSSGHDEHSSRVHFCHFEVGQAYINCNRGKDALNATGIRYPPPRPRPRRISVLLLTMSSANANKSFGTQSPPLEATGDEQPMGVSSIRGDKPQAVPDKQQRQGTLPVCGVLEN